MSPDGDVVHAAGGVVWRRRKKRTEVLLVHRPRRDDWSLPKGKATSGENPLQTAAREVREETGLAVTMGVFLTQTRYTSFGQPKRVDYWAMRLDKDSDGNAVPEDVVEVDGAQWVSLPDALEQVSYDTDRDVLGCFGEHGEVTVRMLLVRHASAGDRASWKGDDDLRPLDARGREQATALATTLDAFGPRRVVSAGPLRCEQTVAPLAHRLGLRAEPVPYLSDREFTAQPARTMKALGKLLSSGGPVVVCSQGGVIPTAVAQLKPARLRRIPKTRKGSVWAIGVRQRTTTTADYYSDLSKSRRDR